jgi:PiT family inorganic phosphate transporter
MLILLFVSVCFLSYANGANDNFKGVATLYGSGVASYRLAISGQR